MLFYITYICLVNADWLNWMIIFLCDILLISIFIIPLLLMQKHQEWLDNRTYEQHIICLTKIKENSRKSQIKSAVHCRKRRLSHNKQPSDDEM